MYFCRQRRYLRKIKVGKQITARKQLQDYLASQSANLTAKSKPNRRRDADLLKRLLNRGEQRSLHCFSAPSPNIDIGARKSDGYDASIDVLIRHD